MMDYVELMYIQSPFLISSFCFGYFYRKIKDKNKKKWLGTCFGLLLVLIITNIHFLHSLFMFLTNAVIVLHSSKRYCHLVSFFSIFSYLFYVRSTLNFGHPSMPFQTDLLQMMETLRLIGLAFEVNSEYWSKKNKEYKGDELNVNFADIFHYTFNFVGILTGPYFSYKTFMDCFKYPFSTTAPNTREVIEKMVYSTVFVLLVFMVNAILPMSYALSEEFYNDRSWLYRYFYSWTCGLIFRFQIYSGFSFLDAICIVAGVGAYPSITEPKPGFGPTKNIDQLKKIAKYSPEDLAKVKYNFTTICSINIYETEFCTTGREMLRNWSMTIQYWFVFAIHKHFPIKVLRAFATFLGSAFWHGLDVGNYTTLTLVPFYLMVENLYVQHFLSNNKGLSLKLWEWIIWFFKMQTFSYWSMGFLLLEYHKVFRYYSSTYYCGFIGTAVLFTVGIIIAKAKRKSC